MKACFLLYSIADILEFLSFPCKKDCELFSFIMDGQRVFIVKIHKEETLERFLKYKKNPDQTMIGCTSLSMNLKKEELSSLTEYINSDEEERLLFNRHQYAD